MENIRKKQKENVFQIMNSVHWKEMISKLSGPSLHSLEKKTKIIKYNAKKNGPFRLQNLFNILKSKSSHQVKGIAAACLLFDSFEKNI